LARAVVGNDKETVMTSSTIKRFVLVCTMALGIAALTLSAYADNTCKVRDGSCGVKIIVKERTHPPYPLCQSGDTSLEVILEAVCGPNKDSKTFLKCASASDQIIWTDNSGVTHELVLVHGATWGDVYNGECFRIQYTNNS
jgi:hypothetical protein